MGRFDFSSLPASTVQVNSNNKLKHLLSSCQSGSRSLHSTLTALLGATNSWSVNIDNGFLNGAVFIDRKRTDREIILRKLSYFGFDQATTKWFQSYISNRTQRCNVNGNLSTSSTVTCRVPQGSILGSLLFWCILTISLTACGLLRRECLLMTPI